MSTIDMNHEVTYGQTFPLRKITELVKKQGKWADATLLDIIQAAHRSSQEKRATDSKKSLPNEQFE